MLESKWQNKRRELHQLAELSNQEYRTAQYVVETLKQYQPDALVSKIGGHGVLAIYLGDGPGPTTLIRAELDALPIEENSVLPYRSQHLGCAHKCGHDGHMTIVLSLAEQLHRSRPKFGRVILAFQSAEETGEGAEAMVSDDKFLPYIPDYAFALHNYPGMKTGKVGVKAGTFNCASKGMIIKLFGDTSHAAYPEHGNSPAIAMCELVRIATNIADQIDDICWCTVIHAKLGEVAFGTSPGEAVVMLTLRSETNDTMELLQERIEQQVAKIIKAHSLTNEITFQDEFRATTNDSVAADLISKSCQASNVDCIDLNEPMRWSEDFGRFTEVAKHGALFVLGSGETTPQLHHPSYDFPDELLIVGKTLFLSLISDINQFEQGK